MPPRMPSDKSTGSIIHGQRRRRRGADVAGMREVWPSAVMRFLYVMERREISYHGAHLAMHNRRPQSRQAIFPLRSPYSLGGSRPADAEAGGHRRARLEAASVNTNGDHSMSV